MGTEVAGQGGGHDFIHVAVAQEVLRRRHCGRLAFQHIQMVHDVEDAAREAVYVLRAGAAGAGGFGVEAGHAQIDGGGDGAAGRDGRWMSPQHRRAEDASRGQGAPAYIIIIAMEIAGQGRDVTDNAGAVQVDEEVGCTDELAGEPVGDALGQRAGL